MICQPSRSRITLWYKVFFHLFDSWRGFFWRFFPTGEKRDRSVNRISTLNSLSICGWNSLHYVRIFLPKIFPFDRFELICPEWDPEGIGLGGWFYRDFWLEQKLSRRLKGKERDWRIFPTANFYTRVLLHRTHGLHGVFLDHTPKDKSLGQDWQDVRDMMQGSLET